MGESTIVATWMEISLPGLNQRSSYSDTTEVLWLEISNTCEWKLRPSCSIAQTVSSRRPPIRVTRASSRSAMARRSTVAKWCTTAIDSTASNDSSRNGRHMLSHTTTCNWISKQIVIKDKLIGKYDNELK